MVRLLAPEGCSSYSYKGVDHDVPSDGFVDVAPDVSVALRPHGFLPPNEVVRAAVKDEISLSRDDLNEMLSHLGFAVADTALPAVKMAEMLKAAVKAKAQAVKKAESDLADGAGKAAADVSGKADDKNKRG